MRKAVIDGETMQGVVLHRHRPVSFVSVRVYVAKKVVWTGKTGKDGTFETSHLEIGEYRVVISRWGAAEIKIRPEAVNGFGQKSYFTLLFSDNNCVGAIEVTN